MKSFDEIQKANESIKTTTITRKDKKTGKVTSKEYAEVNQRIKAFRMLYPEGCIQTEILGMKDGIVTIKATVMTHGSGFILAVGHAQEKEDSTFINETSYIENCETSAVGRALGMCGIGIETSVASAEEVSNAMANQGKIERPASEKQLYMLQKLGYDGDLNLTMKEASDAISRINEANRGK